MPHLHTLALARETLARIALERGDAGEAGSTHSSCRRSRHGPAVPATARSRTTSGDAPRPRPARPARRATRLHAALASHSELGSWSAKQPTCSTSSPCSPPRRREVERGARLAGGRRFSAVTARLCARPRAQSNGSTPRVPSSPPASGTAAGSSVGAGRRRCAHRRDRLRAPAAAGRRDRPPRGWASLTPTELDVASLAAGGMTNPRSPRDCSSREAPSRCTSPTSIASSASQPHRARRGNGGHMSDLRSCGQVADVVLAAEE